MMSNAPTIHIFKKSKKAAGERIHYPSSPESWDINLPKNIPTIPLMIQAPLCPRQGSCKELQRDWPM